MNFRITATSLAILLSALLGGCGSLNPINPPVVHAAPPPPSAPQFGNGASQQLWGGPQCSQSKPTDVIEAFARGTIQPDGSTVDEGDDFLEFSSGVYSFGCVMSTSYTTRFDHSVQSVQYQMGSGKDMTGEWAFWVDATLPNGKQINILKKQFDKHTDYRGNGTGEFSTSLFLPTGTVIRMQRPMVICIADPLGSSCITGQSVNFVGKT
jgi:hypothetical protein